MPQAGGVRIGPDIIRRVNLAGEHIFGSLRGARGFPITTTASGAGLIASSVDFLENAFKISRPNIRALTSVNADFVNTIISKTPKFFKQMGRHPWRAGMILTGLTMGVNMLGGLMKTFRSEPVGRIASAGTGPGYISWAKQSGIPRNHLSTDGLSLALHKMRHASTI